MGRTVKWAELAERIGTGVFDFEDRLAEEGRKFACQLWRDFPDFISTNNALDRSFTRGYFSRLCSDGPLPNLDPPPFTGGQCPGVLYDVTVNNIGYNISNCAQVINNFPVFSVLGPVQGTVFEVTTPAQATTSCNGLSASPVDLGNWVLKSASPDQVTSVNVYQDPTGTANPPLSSANITNVVRNDGLPDDCGNLPTQYPTTSPNPATDFNTQVNITIEDGGDLFLDLEYIPTPFTFPINLDINGIKVVLDLTGATFNFGVNFNGGGGGTLPDGQPQPLPAPDDDLNLILPEPYVPPVNDDNYEEEDRTETDPKEEDVGEELEFVRVTLTTIPDNARIQNGDDGPDVYYAGWFEFTSEGYNYGRQPIHWISSLFKKPPGATGYAYTLYQGFNGNATLYKKLIEVT